MQPVGPVPSPSIQGPGPASIQKAAPAETQFQTSVSSAPMQSKPAASVGGGLDMVTNPFRELDHLGGTIQAMMKEGNLEPAQANCLLLQVHVGRLTLNAQIASSVMQQSTSSIKETINTRT